MQTFMLAEALFLQTGREAEWFGRSVRMQDNRFPAAEKPLVRIDFFWSSSVVTVELATANRSTKDRNLREGSCLDGFRLGMKQLPRFRLNCGNSGMIGEICNRNTEDTQGRNGRDFLVGGDTGRGDMSRGARFLS